MDYFLFIVFLFLSIKDCSFHISSWRYRFLFYILQCFNPSRFLSFFLLILSLSLSHRTFFTGPLSHYFYAWLQKTFPGKDVPTSIKKILCDRLVFAPPYLLIFFYLLGIIEVMFAVVQHLLQALFHPKYEVRARFAVGLEVRSYHRAVITGASVVQLFCAELECSHINRDFIVYLAEGYKYLFGLIQFLYFSKWIR